MTSVVSVTKYIESPESMKTAIESCNGFGNLKPGDRVLIKPNLVAWDDRYPIAPYGVFTTTRLVEDLIICLKNFGCTAITIGEGSVQLKKDVGTKMAFSGLGYTDLEKRYGVSLVDFNDSNAVKFIINDHLKLHVAEDVVAHDFVIDFPVLKTHGQTRVSLGLKNLKGCLKLTSKRLCHDPKQHLEDSFSHIADIVRPSLTIIDGIYALEKGALHFGNAYRKDLIVASTDILAADLAGAKLMGYDGADILHFGHYAGRHGKSVSIDDYKIAGERLEDHVQPLKWDWSWTADNTGPAVFAKLGITGTALPKYDETLCSGCSPIANMSNILVLSAFKEQPLPAVEILNGKKMQARPGYDKTVLLGNCIIRANEENENIKEAVKVKGCPPAEEDVVAALTAAGLDVNVTAYHDYLKQQGCKYDGRDGYAPAHFQAS